MYYYHFSNYIHIKIIYKPEITMNPDTFLRPFLLAAYFCCLGLLTANAQDVIINESGGTAQIHVDNMPPLKAFVGASETPTPSYEYFWVTNDGQFYFTREDTNTIMHNYDYSKLNALGFGDSVAVNIFVNPVYSDIEEEDPPKMIGGGGPGKAEPNIPDIVPVITDTNQFVQLLRSDDAIVPYDRNVFVLSAKNNLNASAIPGTSTPPFLEGYLILLYDSPVTMVRQESREGSPSQLVGGSSIGTLAQPQFFTEFSYVQDYIYYANSAFMGADLDVSGISLGESFRKMAVFRVDSLLSGEERHLFLEMENDEVHLDKILSTSPGKVDFVALFLAREPFFSDPPVLPELSNEQDSIITAIKFDIPSLDQLFSDIVLQDPLYQVIDLSYGNAQIARSHDPNLITLEACACPAGSNAAQKVICRIDFENTGAGNTEDVVVTIPFPSALSVASIPDSMIDISPSSQALLDAMIVTRDESSNELIVEFPGLYLAGKIPGVDNYLQRTGHFSFEIFTRPGTDLNQVGAVQARIVFDENEPIFTPPDSIELLTPQQVPDALVPYALSCATCEVGEVPPPVNNDALLTKIVCGLPLWLWLLILLVIGIAIYFAFFHDRDS